MVTLVRDWMTFKPFSVREDAAAVDALDTMVEQGIRHLPVTDGDNSVLGVLSIDDLRGAFPFEVSWQRPLDPAERDEVWDVSVADAMTWVPRTVHPEDTLDHAVRLLAEHRIGCLPVVDSRDELVGILSETDALRALDALLKSGDVAKAPPRKDDAECLVDELWSERGRLVEQLAKWKETERALLDEVPDPGDLVDRAADGREVAAIEPLSARAEHRLQAIELALERAEHGRLGICDRCHGRIPRTRLRAIPETTLCVRCAREVAVA